MEVNAPVPRWRDKMEIEYIWIIGERLSDQYGKGCKLLEVWSNG